MNTEELRIYLRTVADTAGAKQTEQALKGVQQQATLSGRAVSSGLGASTKTLVEFAGALGLATTAAGAAQQAIQAIGAVLGSSIQAQRENERVTRAVAAAYGQQAQEFQRFATALSTETGFSSQAILQAALSARTLTANYGLTIEQTQRLIRVSADLARIRGIGVAEAFERVQSAIRGEAEASEYLGLTLNDTFLKNQAMNGSLKNTFETMSEGEKAQVRYVELLRQAAPFAGQAASATDSLDAAFGRVEVSANKAQLAIGKTAQPSTVIALNIAANAMGLFATNTQMVADSLVAAVPPLTALKGLLQTISDIPELPIFRRQAAEREQRAALNAELDLQQRVLLAHEEARVAAIRAAAAARAAQQAAAERVVPAAALNQVDATIRRLTADLELFGQRAAQLASILGALPLGDVLLRASVQAEQAMQRIDQAVTARLAAAEKLRRARDLEQGAARVFDPRDAAGRDVALRRIALTDQLEAAYRDLGMAQQAQTELQRESVNLAAEEARLRLSMVPAQQQMAEAQRQMTEQQIRARRAALPATEALEDLRFAQQRAELISRNRNVGAEQRIAARRELRTIGRALPGAELTALEAGRGVTLAGRAAERFGMEQQLFEINNTRQLEQITLAQTANGYLSTIAGQKTQAIELTINLTAEQFETQIFKQLIEAEQQAQGPTTIKQSGVRR